MVDTGASHTLITRSLLNTFPDIPVLRTSSVSATLGDASTTIRIHGFVRLCVFIQNIPTHLSAFVVDSLGVDFILGMDWCYKYNVSLRIRQRKLLLRHPSHGQTSVSFLDTISVPVRLANTIQLAPFHEHIVRLVAPLSSASHVSYIPDVAFCKQKNVFIPDALLKIDNFYASIVISNAAKTPCTLYKNTVLGSITFFPVPISFSSLFSSVSSQPSHTPLITAASIQSTTPTSTISHIDSTISALVTHLADLDEQRAILAVLRRYQRVFDVSKHTIAKTELPHVIITGDHPPISARPYYRNVEQRKQLQKEIDHLLLDHIIRPSTSPWSSPVILKKKLDGTFRFLVDFRRLNSITKKDAYPQPSAEELIYRLSGHRYFTKLDLKSGYFQIPIASADKEKTAFVTPDGHYEFNVLPQGLTNAPASFQRVMNNLIATGRWDYVVIYLDDIVIFSHTFEEHLRHLDEILSILDTAQFKISPPKCTIAAHQIEFLGHFVTATTVEPIPEKIQAILDIPPPRTLSQANRFLGKIGYYRKFIPDFANIAAPLHKVTNKTRTKRHEFYWHADQQAAFETFKKILTTAPLFLHFPDPSLPFILSTDASLTRIAGVLKQDTSSGLKICYYKSRLLSDVERRYSATEREALAICWCLDQLRSCIGSSSILVETDHKPLANMHKNYNFGNKRIDNWLLKLQDLLPQITAIKYRKGIDNVGPDFLTRYEPLSSPSGVCSVSVDPSLMVPPCPTSSSSPSTDLSGTPDIHTAEPITISPVVTRSKSRAAIDPLPISDADTDDDDEYFDALDSTSSPLTPSPLSPSNLDSSTLDLSFPCIKTHQHSDCAILAIIERLRQNPSSFSEYVLRDDILLRVIPGPTQQSPRFVPYLPKSLIPLALQFYHDHPLSGHFGVHRTLARLRERFWWPNMRSTVQNYVGSCDPCARHNIRRTKSPGHLKSIEPPSDVFQVLHMDFWGPVRTPSASGNRYVLILTDNLSKYVIAQALPDCTARSVAQFLIDRFILVHGAPERLITDNGTHFNNNLLRAITSSMHIPHAFSVAYRPQSNGQVERFNATFAAQLAKYCDPDHHDWDLYLPSIVYAYNTSVHSTTRLTPYEAAFARRPKSPFDSVSSTVSLPPLHSFYPYLQSIRRLLVRQARTNVLRHQNLWQQRYNHNRRDMSYRIGDLVFVPLSTTRNKLDARRQGPFVVIDRSGQQTYLVQDNTTGKTAWYHVSQLHPVLERALS